LKDAEGTLPRSRKSAKLRCGALAGKACAVLGAISSAQLAATLLWPFRSKHRRGALNEARCPVRRRSA